MAIYHLGSPSSRLDCEEEMKRPIGTKVAERYEFKYPAYHPSPRTSLYEQILPVINQTCLPLSLAPFLSLSSCIKDSLRPFLASLAAPNHFVFIICSNPSTVSKQASGEIEVL